MRKYIFLLLITAAFTGCKKTTDDVTKPVKTGTNGNSTSGQYSVKFNIDDQAVLTSVKADTLFLTYQEKVSLLLNPDDYQKSSAVHLKEEFAKSGLTDYQYKILNDERVYRYNSADDNLNNNTSFINASTVNVDGAKYIKLTLQRDFIFYKAYKLEQLAAEAQTNILNVTTDKVSFSSYYYYDQKNSAAVAVTANLVYKKIK